MRQIHAKSDCPINFSLETFGDRWSLLILRDIIYFRKKTFNEFLASDEGIARNILADRLDRLQKSGILTRKPHPADKRKELYELTEEGLRLIPLLLELAAWGATHVPQASLPHEWLQTVQSRPKKVTPLIHKAVGQGESIFVGDNSVIKQLGIN
ncbi:MAG TPA: helix-turn-helix domain-containing protein [Bacillota bacterium]|nr:helix-turn-helix domain-containing protein [Bacillota bacterium]